MRLPSIFALIIAYMNINILKGSMMIEKITRAKMSEANNLRDIPCRRACRMARNEYVIGNMYEIF